jgi:hypothetical protein
MSENEHEDGAKAPAAEPAQFEALTEEAFIPPVGIPDPRWPAPTGESARAHFEGGADPAKRPPMEWASQMTKGDLDAKAAVWQEEAAANVRAAMATVVGGDWPTLDECIPPGSLLHLIDDMFVETTDIPRELPVFAAIHYVAALLLQKGVVISVVNEEWRPDVWTICMAESGSGKSFASSKIGKALGGAVDLFPDSNSSAKFAEDLRDHNRGLWMRDDLTCLSC